jgi:hypothetical protein
MTNLLIQVCIFTTVGALVFSGITHIGHRRILPDALVDQQVVRRSHVGFIAGVVTGAELVAGLGGVMAFALLPNVSRWFFAVTALLYFVFAGYGTYLLMHRPGSRCGCSSQVDRVTIGTVVRAGVLLVLALVASVLARSSDAGQIIGLEGAISLLASLAFGVIIWNLPGALQDPLANPLLRTITRSWHDA